MKKLEPGMLCRVVGASIPENNGRIVTLVEFVETPAEIPFDGAFWVGRDWWRIKESLKVGAFGESTARADIPYAKQQYLQPINPDHQPADEEWQADFKRLLSGNKQTVKSGGNLVEGGGLTR